MTSASNSSASAGNTEAGFGSATAFNAWLASFEKLSAGDKAADVKLMLQIVSKIVEQPNEAKWRKLNSAKVLSKLQAKDSVALIESLGFVSFDGFHTLPAEAAIAPLQTAKAWLEKKRDELTAAAAAAAAQASRDKGDGKGVDGKTDSSQFSVLSNVWKIRMEFRNSQHAVLDTLVFPEQAIPWGTRVRKWVDPEMLKKLKALGFPGFGLWASHDPVKEDTEFDDILYLRGDDGVLVLQVEDHNCQYRAITVKQHKYDKCLVCGTAKALDKPVLMCFHMCCCDDCWKKVMRCPVCRKRKGH